MNLVRLYKTLISRSLLWSLGCGIYPESTRTVRRCLSIAIQRSLVVILVFEVDESRPFGLARVVHQHTHVDRVHTHRLQNEGGLVPVHLAKVAHEDRQGLVHPRAAAHSWCTLIGALGLPVGLAGPWWVSSLLVRSIRLSASVVSVGLAALESSIE